MLTYGVADQFDEVHKYVDIKREKDFLTKNEKKYLHQFFPFLEVYEHNNLRTQSRKPKHCNKLIYNNME